MKAIKSLAALGTVVGLSLGALLSPAYAEPLSIVGFETGTGMAFAGATVSNYYTLEFAPTVAGPWTNWGSVSGQAITGTVMSLPTPFFYRIRQTDSSAIPPYAPASKIPGSMLADGAITPAKLAPNSVDLAGSVVTGKLSDARISDNVALLNRTNQTFSGENVFADKVGIGATAPIYPLVVQKRSIAEPAIMIGGGYPGGPRFQTYGLDETPNAWMGLGTDMSGGIWEHSLYFPAGPTADGVQTIGSYDGTNYSEKMRITAAGKVGIGTHAPAEQLDVAGAVKMGTTANPAPAAGTIRWTGTDFQGFNGSQWISLAAPGSASGDMVLVPGGTFTMGSVAAGYVPEHLVTLSSFYLNKYETTYALWYSVRQWALANGYTFQNAGREGCYGTNGAAPTAASGEPVTYISWRDSIVWCNARSEKDGLAPVYTYDGQVIRDSRDANSNICDSATFNTGNSGYRLPTEAEWECAARYVDGWSWSPGDFLSGAGSNWTNAPACDAVGWYAANSGFHTHTAGTKMANQLGGFDMSGNVWEWCWDWLGDYDGGAATNPTGPPGPASYRTMRGGSLAFLAYYVQCATRNGHYPDYKYYDVGFRCVRGL